MIEIIQTPGKLAWKVTLHMQHHDERGGIYQTMNSDEFFKALAVADLLGVTQWGEEHPPWKQENVIVERRGSLRGLHCDDKAWKLIACLYGTIRLVLFDPKTKQSEVFDWSVFPSRRTYQILVPPNIFNGHSVQSHMAVFHYLWSETFENAQPRRIVKWHDPALVGVDWRVVNPILSERDK